MGARRSLGVCNEGDSENVSESMATWTRRETETFRGVCVGGAAPGIVPGFRAQRRRAGRWCGAVPGGAGGELPDVPQVRDRGKEGRCSLRACRMHCVTWDAAETNSSL